MDRLKMLDHPCCRINRGKMHYEVTKGTENKVSDHQCCRINRGKMHYENTKGAGKKCRIILIVQILPSLLSATFLSTIFWALYTFFISIVILIIQKIMYITNIYVFHPAIWTFLYEIHTLLWNLLLYLFYLPLFVSNKSAMLWYILCERYFFVA